MTNEEFQDYDGAPLELEDFADAAATITDNDSLKEAAIAFNLAKTSFENELNFNGISLG